MTFTYIYIFTVTSYLNIFMFPMLWHFYARNFNIFNLKVAVTSVNTTFKKCIHIKLKSGLTKVRKAYGVMVNQNKST